MPLATCFGSTSSGAQRQRCQSTGTPSKGCSPRSSKTDGPALFDRPTVIAVAEDISVSKGNLRRVSPEEPEHAYLFALKDAITNGESEDVLLQLVRVKVK